MYSAIIKKKKAEKANETKKVNPSGLKGIDDYKSKDLEGAKKIEPKPFIGADKVKRDPSSTKAVKVDEEISKGAIKALKPSYEDSISMDSKMQSAKKKKK